MLPDATDLDPAGVGPSSLVLSSESVDDLVAVCPRRPVTWLVDLNNPGRVKAAGCDAYSCDLCGPRKAQQFARAASWVLTQKERPRFVTLTLAPADWQTRRQRVRDLARRIRSEGLQTEWAWTTEEGSLNGMVHIHAVQWGDYLPQHDLQEWWGARVDIRAVKVTEQAVGAYTVKSAIGVGRYLTKSESADYLRWLDLNGGRPMHTSRGFFMGLGIRGALKAANAAARQGEAPCWAKVDPKVAAALVWLTRTGEADARAHLRYLTCAPEVPGAEPR